MVFERAGVTVGHLREPHPHRRALVQRPACRPWSFQLRPEDDADTEFLAKLPMQCVFGRFARFHLAAREFPHASELRRGSPACHEKPGGSGQGVEHGPADDVDEFSHRSSL